MEDPTRLSLSDDVVACTGTGSGSIELLLFFCPKYEVVDDDDDDDDEDTRKTSTNTTTRSSPNIPTFIFLSYISFSLSLNLQRSE